MYKNKYVKTPETKIPTTGIIKLKQQDIDSCKVITLRQFFPEHLDPDGYDTSLMTSAELEIMVLYVKTRNYLLEKYPQPPQETELHDNVRVNEPNASAQIDTSKAKTDPKLFLFFELIFKMCVIYNKLSVLQSKAIEYEKTCLRLYSHLTYNWNHTPDIANFREEFWSIKEDMFEIVECYFKICKKYKVPTFEEPYYFLTNKQQMEIKLEGDMMRRTGKYSDFEIHLSILEDIP